MAYQLLLNGGAYVNIGLPSRSGRTYVFDIDIPANMLNSEIRFMSSLGSSNGDRFFIRKDAGSNTITYYMNSQNQGGTPEKTHSFTTWVEGRNVVEIYQQIDQYSPYRIIVNGQGTGDQQHKNSYSASWTLYNSIGFFSISTSSSFAGFASGTPNCLVNSVKVYSGKGQEGTLLWDYDPSASNGAGNILHDIQGTRDGTLVNFPSDDSQWIAEDATAPDTTKPVISIDGGISTTIERGSVYTDPTYTITDDTDATRTTGAVITGTVDTSTVGVYYRYFNTTDAAGNAADEVTYYVNVEYTPTVGDEVDDAEGNTWTYVGSFNVDDGPYWGTAPLNYNGIQAAEIVFGALTGEVYGTSTQTHTVNRLAIYDIFQGSNQNLDDSLAVTGNYDIVGDKSAYVDDSLIGATTYVFKRAEPQPINKLQYNSQYVLDVKYYGGIELEDVELKINNEIVWKKV